MDLCAEHKLNYAAAHLHHTNTNPFLSFPWSKKIYVLEQRVKRISTF